MLQLHCIPLRSPVLLHVSRAARKPGVRIERRVLLIRFYHFCMEVYWVFQVDQSRVGASGSWGSC